jgi:hypothetical protein
MASSLPCWAGEHKFLHVRKQAVPHLPLRKQLTFQRRSRNVKSSQQQMSALFDGSLLTWGHRVHVVLKLDAMGNLFHAAFCERYYKVC